MTDAQRIYARAAAPAWREKIEHLSTAHHVSLEMESFACLRAAIGELRRTYTDAGTLLLALTDVVEDLRNAPPDSRERTIS